MKPTVKEIISELKREIRMRHAVYPNQVNSRKLTQEEANFRILCMEEAVSLIEQTQGNQLNLFGE